MSGRDNFDSTENYLQWGINVKKIRANSVNMLTCAIFVGVTLAFVAFGNDDFRLVVAISSSSGGRIYTIAPLAPFTPGRAWLMSVVTFALVWIAPLVESDLESRFSSGATRSAFGPVAKDSRLFTRNKNCFAVDNDPLVALVGAFSLSVSGTFGVWNITMNVTTSSFNKFNSVKGIGFVAVVVVVFSRTGPIICIHVNVVSGLSTGTGALESLKLGKMGWSTFGTFSKNFINWFFVERIHLHLGTRFL
jgi:hypothetical protein